MGDLQFWGLVMPYVEAVPLLQHTMQSWSPFMWKMVSVGYAKTKQFQHNDLMIRKN